MKTYKAPWQLKKIAREQIDAARATGDSRDILRAIEAVFDYVERVDDMREPPSDLR